MDEFVLTDIVGTSDRSGITVSTARSMPDLEQISQVWKGMQNGETNPAPNADIIRYSSIMNSGIKAEPYVMLFREEGNPAAMVIGRAETKTFPIKLGYCTFARPRLRSLTVVYGGVLGEPDERLSSIIVTELQKRLTEFDAVYFNYLRTDTDFFQTVREVPGFFTKDHFIKTSKHWRMSVPDNMDKWYNQISEHCL